MANQPPLKLTRRGQLVVDSLSILGIIAGIAACAAIVRMFA